MWTKDSLIVLITAMFLISLGIWIHNYGFVFAGSFIIVFIFVMRAFFNPGRAKVMEGLRALRKMPKFRLMEDDVVSVDLDISSEKGTELVELYDEMPYYTDIYEGSNDHFHSFAPGEKKRMSYHALMPMRGHFEAGPLMARHTDPAFLFYEDSEILPKEEMFVYPEMLDVYRMEVQSKSLRHYSGPFLSNQPGSSQEFFAIREYTRYDPFNRINWKAYAKTHKLMVNEHEKENICDAIIFVDARLSTGIGSITDNPLKYEIKAALSLAATLLKERDRVSLVTYGEGCEMIPPGYGHTQLEVFKAVLLRTQPKGTAGLWNAVYQATPYLYKKTSVIIITTMDLDFTTVNTVRLLFERGFDVRLMTVPSVPFENKSLGFKTAKNWITDMEHQNNLFYLKETGAKVYDWDLVEPIDLVVRRMNAQQRITQGVFQ